MKDTGGLARRLMKSVVTVVGALGLFIVATLGERSCHSSDESEEEAKGAVEVMSVAEQRVRAARPVPQAEAPRAKAAAPEEAPPSATVVPLGPGDVAPEPEVENPPPQPNDEIQPEQPQTAQWTLEKTTHITALLGRDVERLEREREAAAARGDDERVRQVNALLQRNRGQLDHLRDEIRALTAQAEQEAVNAR